MKKLILLCLIFGVVLSVRAQKVQVGADPGVDESKYKTYAWTDTPLRNPLIKQIIVEAVDQALLAKGLTKVTTNPELTIVVWAATEADLQVAYPNWANAMGTAYSTGIAVGGAWTVTRGTLMVDIADPST